MANKTADKSDLMSASRYYDLADTLLLRITESKTGGLRLGGQVVWSPPWGGSLNLFNVAGARRVGKTIHVLLAMPGNLRLYVIDEPSKTTLAFIDGAASGFSLPDVPSEFADTMLSGIGDAVKATFERARGSKEWKEAA